MTGQAALRVQEVRLEIRAGHVTKIEGGLDAKLMRDCTVALDGRTIIERGKIVDPAMRVARMAR